MDISGFDDLIAPPIPKTHAKNSAITITIIIVGLSIFFSFE